MAAEYEVVEITNPDGTEATFVVLAEFVLNTKAYMALMNEPDFLDVNSEEANIRIMEVRDEQDSKYLYDIETEEEFKQAASLADVLISKIHIKPAVH